MSIGGSRKVSKKELSPTEASTRNLLVLGIGNPLMGDDGIGVVIARRLQNWKTLGVKVIEAGVPGFGLINILASRRQVVIIDAVDSGYPPGSVFWVDPQSIKEDWNRQSLHQVGLADVLSLLALDQDNSGVRIIGIQPERVHAGTTISRILHRRLPIITKKAVEMIKSVNQEQSSEEENQKRSSAR